MILSAIQYHCITNKIHFSTFLSFDNDEFKMFPKLVKISFPYLFHMCISSKFLVVKDDHMCFFMSKQST